MIIHNFRAFLDSYLPSLTNETNDSAALHPVSSFNVDAQIKNIQPMLDMFLPGYHMSDNSNFRCNYTYEGENFDLYFISSDLGHGNIAFKDLSFVISGDKTSLAAEAGSSKLLIGNQVGLENFTLFSTAANDSINVETRWNNWEDIKYNGQLRALALLSPYGADSSVSYKVLIRPTNFYTNDSLWNVSESSISLNGREIAFDNVKISHEGQYFSLDGIISEDPDEVVRLVFKDFGLAYLNGLTENAGFKLGGILNGGASFSDLYHNILFTSELTVDSLAVNDELLGTQI
jgi:hypothetical protein